MRNFDLSPLYRSTVGFDRFATMLDQVLSADMPQPSYPPYNIEKTGDSSYRITLAVAGFAEQGLEIEAREGVTTGISAGDRALTVATAINPELGAADIATPGHLFPLRARNGGVLVRAGHTEAGCDIARLAGCYPSSVICEIMNDDGTMAHLPELLVYSKKHGIKIGTISDLITYRSRNDNLVVQTSQETVSSEFGGDWDMRLFTDQTHGIEHVVLIKGDITTPEPVLCRTHAVHEASDILGLGPKSPSELPRAMELIAAEGRGVVCLFRQPRNALYAAEDEGPRTIKQTGLGAQILSKLGVNELVLLTDSPETRYVGLDLSLIHI